MWRGRVNAVRAPHRRLRLAVGLPQLWATVCLGGIFIVLSLQLVRPPDFWWHAGVGRWIVEKGAIPRVDVFSFTQAGEPYAYQMWLMEVVFYLLLAVGGLPLVTLFNTLTITAAYGLLLRVSWRAASGNLRWASMATLAAAAVGMENWNVRPQTMSFLVFALTLYLLDSRRHRDSASGAQPRSGWALWWLAPLFALWANCHGGFAFGLVLVGTSLLANLLDWLRRKRGFPTQLAIVSLFSGLAVFLTPLGAGMVDYLLGIFKHPVIRQSIVEWMPPTIQTRSGQLYFGLVIACVVLMLASRRRPAAREAIWLLVFGGLALMAGRNVAWFGFVAAPTLAASLARWSGRRPSRRAASADPRRINVAIAGLVGLLGILSLPWFRPYLPLPAARRAFTSPETPAEGVAFLRDLPSPPRVFHSESYGSYMIWASPEVPVFIDTRFELYPPDQWGDYLATSYARYDWAAILEKYGVDTLVLERRVHQPLVDAATEAPGWQQCYEDERTVIFQRGRGL